MLRLAYESGSGKCRSLSLMFEGQVNFDLEEGLAHRPWIQVTQVLATWSSGLALQARYNGERELMQRVFKADTQSAVHDTNSLVLPGSMTGRCCW